MIEIIKPGDIMLPTSDRSLDDNDDGVGPHTPASFSASTSATLPGPVEWIGDHAARVPAGRFDKMTLEVAHGVSQLVVVGAGVEDLVAVRFTGQPPRIAAYDDVVRISHGRNANLFTWLSDLVVHGVHGPTRVALGSSASWKLHITAGVAELRANLADVHLDEIEISGGANDIALQLPRARGVVPLRIRGGASSVLIERPAGSAMRVRVTGGATDLTFDNTYAAAVRGRHEVASPGFDAAADRYEVEVSGGASEVTVVEGEGAAR